MKLKKGTIIKIGPIEWDGYFFTTGKKSTSGWRLYYSKSRYFDWTAKDAFPNEVLKFWDWFSSKDYFREAVKCLLDWGIKDLYWDLTGEEFGDYKKNINKFPRNANKISIKTIVPKNTMIGEVIRKINKKEYELKGLEGLRYFPMRIYKEHIIALEKCERFLYYMGEQNEV